MYRVDTGHAERMHVLWTEEAVFWQQTYVCSCESKHMPTQKPWVPMSIGSNMHSHCILECMQELAARKDALTLHLKYNTMRDI